ncbi:uncharacterized protein RJT21DRAFT_20377 [Scheffersomyces amazonensis]|uniref:uncharacterized protein n=1 Tax=Scheffersomyces amazonensis TaxID=1078765 RepID=UPI00315C71DC
MVSDSSWISSLPLDLQKQIYAAITKHPDTVEVFTTLYNHLQLASEQDDSKRRKVDSHENHSHQQNHHNQNQSNHQTHHQTQSQSKSHAPQPNNGSDYGMITISEPLIPETIIFEISQVSFQSPIRKKMNLIFHLIERDNEALPVLSIVNPTNQIPEISLINLSHSIKLCIIIPILGNSTNPTKKNIVSLCFWINEDRQDPIICQINLDAIKKQMIKLGKLPVNIEQQFANYNESNNLSLHPVHENIIDYFKRQFKLCGINLINYLPGTHIFNNQFTLNNDNALALSNNNISNTIIMVDCHKGAKDGVLLFLNSNEFNQPFIIFGFKKPILSFEISRVKDSSYTNITRLTFSVLFTVVNEKDEEKVIEFSMIDQNFFQIIDDFIKAQNINDNSFDATFKEKQVDNQGQNQENNPDNQPQQEVFNEDDEDDEDDDNYQGGEEEEGEDSDVAEEYDSEAGGDSGDEEEGSEVEDGNFNKNKEVEEIE